MGERKLRVCFCKITRKEWKIQCINCMLSSLLQVHVRKYRRDPRLQTHCEWNKVSCRLLYCSFVVLSAAWPSNKNNSFILLFPFTLSAPVLHFSCCGCASCCTVLILCSLFALHHISVNKTWRENTILLGDFVFYSLKMSKIHTLVSPYSCNV